jgi:hypothetical protein
MLLLATIVAVSASAQVSVRTLGNNQNRQLPFKGIEKKSNVRSEAREGWITPAVYDAQFFGYDALTRGDQFYLDFDSTGYHEYSGGSLGHAFVYSAGQTFDLNSVFYDRAGTAGEDISFRNTEFLNLDSIQITTMYFRNEGVPAGTKDTVIVGVYVSDSIHGYHFTAYENACFWGLDYDATTGIQLDAPDHTNGIYNLYTYKFPIGDEDVSQPAEEEGYYYYAYLSLPINLQNITGKAIHIAYTFKRGYEVAMEDTLKSTFSLCTYASYDPNYNLNTNGSELRCINQSHGDYILKFSDGVNDFYYPGYAISDDDFVMHYPQLWAKFSCTSCEIVNVAEIEKNNPTIYPNPATNNFTVNLGNDEKANIQLYNIVGQQVYSETINGTAQVNVSNLKSGVYMLKINQNGKSYTTKVIVK